MLLSTEFAGHPADPPPGARLVQTDFACIVDHALSERARGLGPMTERLGLSGPALAALSERWLPFFAMPDTEGPAPVIPPEQSAIAKLILWRGGSAEPEARWLAAIIARRAQEPRHLWEDMGLPSRPALTALIARHLPGLAAANRQNMRWKKFLYRQICSEAGFNLCLSPSCEECPEYDACFAPGA